ncbi:serine hydrolase [Moorena producens]|uniref:serine hydrolase n=1 Tax=Moorena producens TaxID=1155739 RepID=UPI003C76EE77
MLKVTSKTLFAIGSCTKAFTTMAMGILAEGGKLDWDKPVRHYLPTFKLWEEFVQQEIFNPLSRVDSNFSVVKSQETDDFSLLYREKDDVVKAIPFRNIDTIGPAGSINSNVTDMAKWLLLHQNQGNYEDKQIINPDLLTQMYTPQIVMPSSLEYPEIWHSFYGLGWMLTSYRGHNHVEHRGGIEGFSALTTLMPQEKIGVVVLSNLHGTLLPSILTYHICDRLLGLDEVPWNERIKSKVEEAKQAAVQGKQNTKPQPKTGTQPSHPLEDYTGDFEHPGYGIVSIALKYQQLTATYNYIVYELKHYHYDSFELLSKSFVLGEDFKLLSFYSETVHTSRTDG